MQNFCGDCGAHARSAASRERDLRARDCPRWGVVHHGCCERAVCSDVDARGHVRCAWWRGGRERAGAERVPPPRHQPQPTSPQR